MEELKNENIKNFFEFEVSAVHNGERLDKYISSQLDEATRTYIEKLIDGNYVLLNSKICNKNGKKLKTGDKIFVNIPEEEDVDIVPENIELKIVYENEDFILINKSYDMVVHPAYGNYSGTLVNALMYYTQNLSSVNGKIRPGIIHRLDKDTSGLIMVAKNNNSHAKLATMFIDKTIHKTYLCIVKGNFSEENLSGKIENLIGRDSKDRKKMAIVEKNGKIAVSNYKVVQQVEGYSLVEVGIETGRTHQIRVHSNYMKHPIIGDDLYGYTVKKFSKITGQVLHARKLGFIHPSSGEYMEFNSELPEYFLDVMKKAKE